MAFALLPRKRKPDDPQFLTSPPPAPPDADPAQFKEDVAAQPTRLSPDAAEPPVPVRPKLKLTPAETDTQVPDNTVTLRPSGATAVRPQMVLGQTPAEPVDPYDADTAELADRNRPDDQNPYLVKHNSKLKSGLKALIIGAGSAANRALASGSRNPLAEAVGGAGGGFVAGAINDRWDENAANEKRKAELQQNIGFTLERRKREGDITDQETTDALRTAQTAALPLKTLAETNKSAGEILNAQQSRILEEYKAAGHYTLGENPDFESRAAQAGMKLTPYSAKDTAPGRFNSGGQEYEYVKGPDGQYHARPVTDAAGRPLPAGADPKIPDTFYRGKGHEDEIKNDSMAEVLAKPEYHVTGMRPDVMAAYGDDMDKVQRAIRSGELKPGEIFTDPTKGAMFQRDLAATHARLSRDANGFDAALDMTSKSPGATDMTLADFQQAYKTFQTKFSAAKDDKERQDLSRRFQTELKRVRVR